MFLLSYAATILALLLLWAVYPQDYNYGQAAGKGLLFYPANAVGQLPVDNPIPWRNSSLLYEKAPKFGFDDLTGGWMVGGIAGLQLVWHYSLLLVRAAVSFSGMQYCSVVLVRLLWSFLGMQSLVCSACEATVELFWGVLNFQLRPCCQDWAP